MLAQIWIGRVQIHKINAIADGKIHQLTSFFGCFSDEPLTAQTNGADVEPGLAQLSIFHTYLRIRYLMKAQPPKTCSKSPGNPKRISCKDAVMLPVCMVSKTPPIN